MDVAYLGIRANICSAAYRKASEAHLSTSERPILKEMSKEREALQVEFVRLRVELESREKAHEDEWVRVRLEDLEQKEVIKELLARQERLERIADALAEVPGVAERLKDHTR